MSFSHLFSAGSVALVFLVRLGFCSLIDFFPLETVESPAPTPYGYFGLSCDICVGSEGTAPIAIVGDRDNDAAYIYTLDEFSNEWSLTATLNQTDAGPDAPTGGSFAGWRSVALGGVFCDFAIISAPYLSDANETIYLYNYDVDDDSWSLSKTIKRQDPEIDNDAGNLGIVVAADRFSDTVAFASNLCFGFFYLINGCVFIYQRVNDEWLFASILNRTSLGLDDNYLSDYNDFGNSGIGISNGTIAVAAEMYNSGKGGIFMFDSLEPYVAGELGWELTQVVQPEVYGGNYFGSSVEINLDILVGGCFYCRVDISDTSSIRGVAYVFERNSTTGEWEQKIMASTQDAGFTQDVPVLQWPSGISVGNVGDVSGDGLDEQVIIVTDGGYWAFVYEKDKISGEWIFSTYLNETVTEIAWDVAVEGEYTIMSSSRPGVDGSGQAIFYGPAPPTRSPTVQTQQPTQVPSTNPSTEPTVDPTTSTPSAVPTRLPTTLPSGDDITCKGGKECNWRREGEGCASCRPFYDRVLDDNTGLYECVRNDNPTQAEINYACGGKCASKHCLDEEDFYCEDFSKYWGCKKCQDAYFRKTNHYLCVPCRLIPNCAHCNTNDKEWGGCDVCEPGYELKWDFFFGYRRCQPIA